MEIHPVFRPPNALPFDFFFGWTTKVVFSRNGSWHLFSAKPSLPFLFNQSRPILGGVLYLESSSKFLGLMSPWYEHPADSSRMMIPAYQNDLQMFPIFRMQFASLDDLCMKLLFVVKTKLHLRVPKYFWVRQLRRLFLEFIVINLESHNLWPHLETDQTRWFEYFFKKYGDESYTRLILSTLFCSNNVL